MRWLRWLGIAVGIVLILIVAAIGGALFYVSSDGFKDMVAGRAGKATGRDVAIDGDIDIDWGWTTKVRLQKVRIGNADWGSAPEMGSADAIEASIKLAPLLKGDIVLPELVMERPQLLLERNRDGESNWEFSENPAASTAAEAASPDDRTEFPIIGRLLIRDGRLTYRDPARGIDVASRVDTATGSASKREEVQLKGDGTFEGKPFKITLTAGSLLQLREADEPYPIEFDARVGETGGRITGTMGDPIKMEGLDLRLDLSGPSLAELFPIFGTPLPKSPPYKLAGHLEREGDRWKFSDFKGGIGDSDMSGDLAIDTGGERPVLTATLISNRLDFDDLAGLIGATPSTEPGEAASAEQKKEAEKEKKDDRILPDAEVDLERLRAMDMKVTLVGKDVIAPSLPMQDFKATFNLQNGRLTVDPLSFGLAGGRIAGKIVLNGREKVPGVAADLKISQIDLAKFFKGSQFAEEMGGIVGGRVELDGSGRSTAEILGSGNGGLVLAMQGGKFSNLLLELIGIDIAEALGFYLGKDKPVALRCAVADFRLQKGVLKAETLVVDTTDTNVTGKGKINLRDESMDFKLEAHPKDPSLFSARTPVLIGGTLADPEFGVDPSQAVARGAAAVVLGALLTPLAALLPMIELGLGKDSNCHKLISRADTGTSN